ncbi:MAG: hypothetical protein H9802_05685 [Candidatus Phocaeicola faecipullorum]|nr:hypothetical protein [Candidatus Phocaeicola faecipullorum]
MWIIIIVSIILFFTSKKFSKWSGNVLKRQLEPSEIKFLACCILLVTVFLNSATYNKKESEKETQKEVLKEIPEVDLQKAKEQRIERMFATIKKDSAYLKNYDYKDKALQDIPTMKASITFLSRIKNGNYRIANSDVVDKYPNCTKTFDYMEKESEKILKKALPLYRKQVTQIMKDRLWEENINVSVSGNANTVLWFTGGIFASNKQIKLFQEQIESEVRTFGFKRTCYKWIKHDNEYTYYDLN